MRNICVFLCDLTGIMAKPWLDAGYECWLFDAQHPEGVTTEGLLNKVGCWLNSVEDVFKYITPNQIKFVCGFPECTDLAVSGARHFAAKKLANPAFQEDAMKLVYLCRDIGEQSGAPWILENPISVISTLWRKPDYKFHPYEYGQYLWEDDIHPLYPEYIPPRDAYTKSTCIWAGNGFVMPDKLPVEVSGTNFIHKKLGGKSLKTKNIRSATPRGFALAVFLANQ